MPTLVNEITTAIVGENLLVSRVFQVGGEESVQNLELITDGNSRLITNGQGQYIETGRNPKVILNGQGRAIATGNGKYILAF